MKILNIVLEGLFDVSQSYHENNLIRAQILDGNDVYILASTRKSRAGNNKYKECSEKIYGSGTLIRKELKNKRFLALGKLIDADIDEIIEQISPDLIILHGISSLIIKRVYNYKKKHQDVIVFAINHLDDIIFDLKKFKNKLYRFKFASINKKYGSCIDGLYGVTNGRVTFLREKLGFPNRNIKLTVMGGFTQEVNPTLVTIDEKIHKEENRFYFYTGGKLDRHKKIVEIVTAFSRLKDANIRLVLFGNIEKSCKEEVASILENDTRIIQLGWLDQTNISYLISELDCAFFPGQHSVLWEQILLQGKTGVFGQYKGMEHIFMYGNSIGIALDSSTDDMFMLMANIIDDKNGIFSNAKKNAIEYSGKFDIRNNWIEIKKDYENIRQA